MKRQKRKVHYSAGGLELAGRFFGKCRCFHASAPEVRKCVADRLAETPHPTTDEYDILPVRRPDGSGRVYLHCDYGTLTVSDGAVLTSTFAQEDRDAFGGAVHGIEAFILALAGEGVNLADARVGRALRDAMESCEAHLL